jgi:hypothetical protein
MDFFISFMVVATLVVWSSEEFKHHVGGFLVA